MQLSITKQITLVLIIPLLGAFLVTGVYYLYLNQTASSVSFLNIAGRQRMLSEQIHHYAEMVVVKGPQAGDKLPLLIEAFDHSLKILRNGGLTHNKQLPPAPPEVDSELLIVQANWELAKPALLSLLNTQVPTSKHKAIYQLSESYIHNLASSLNQVAHVYEDRINRINNYLFSLVVVITALDLLLLLAGIWVIRHYVNEHEEREKQARNDQGKQAALHKMLEITLLPYPLPEKLNLMLDILLSVPLLEVQPRGCIFLMDKSSDVMQMVAQKGMPDQLINTCSEIASGECLCGQAASTKETIYSNNVSSEHIYRLNAPSEPHGNICMPLLSGGKVLGVLNIYTKENFSDEIEDEEFFSSAANTLAATIQNQQDTDALQKQTQVLEDIHDAVASFDLDGFIETWNKGAEIMFGYKAHEVIGRSMLSLFPENEHKLIQKEVIKPLLEQGSHESEIKMHRKNGEIFYAHSSLNLIRNEEGYVTGIIGYSIDITDQYRAETELASRIKQQAGIAELGQQALQHSSLDEFLDQAVGLIAGVLQVDYCKILELSTDTNNLLLKAGEGWAAGLVGKAEIDAGDDSQAGFTLKTNNPVIVADLARETRFSGPQLLLDHNVVSGASVIISGDGIPYGLLGVHTTAYRKFNKEDIIFLRTAANIISEAIEHEQFESKLSENEQRFRNLVETSSDWIWEINENGIYTYSSPHIQDLLGYTPGEVIGKTPFDLMLPDEGERVRTLFNSIIRKQQNIVALENINQHKDGHAVILETSGVPVYDTNGKYSGYRGIDRDITERKQGEKHLEQLAHYDHLTGLPNRALFFDRLQQALARAPWRKRMVAILFIDLDRFKIINDTLGHDIGDQLLSEVAARLAGFVRDGDTVARLGGDEFAIILDDIAESDDILNKVSMIHAVLEKPVSINGRELFVTASIGISCFPNDGSESKVLVTRADIAMYHAKEQGRNNFQFYSEEMDQSASERLQMETRLRRALENKEYLAYYQPKLNLKTGKICGIEALLRWMSPSDGLIQPLQFIPLLEDTGLIVPVGEWMLRSACQQTLEWHEAGHNDLVVAVNLSARQFKHQKLEEIVINILEETGLDPRYLELEITESILMEDIDETINVLRKLDAYGVNIVIDDFGTGYSSLSYLKQFPISTLKIDRSFIIDVLTDADDAILTQAIVAMSHSLNISVVAEGAETEEQMKYLRDINCDEVQGYYISKPLAVDDMTSFLHDNSGSKSSFSDKPKRHKKIEIEKTSATKH